MPAAGPLWRRAAGHRWQQVPGGECPGPELHPARLATLQRDIDRTIARYLRELERQDAAEAGTDGPSADALREKIATLQQRRTGYAALAEELAASGETARSVTDPDSRPMRSGGRIEVCYNVQTAVDAKHKLCAC